MRETRTTCSRCDATTVEDSDDWVRLDAEETMETFNRTFDAIDLCPDCLDSFWVWFLHSRLDEHELEAFRAAEGLGEYAEE